MNDHALDDHGGDGDVENNCGGDDDDDDDVEDNVEDNGDDDDEGNDGEVNDTKCSKSQENSALHLATTNQLTNPPACLPCDDPDHDLGLGDEISLMISIVIITLVMKSLIMTMVMKSAMIIIIIMTVVNKPV